MVTWVSAIADALLGLVPVLLVAVVVRAVGWPHLTSLAGCQWRAAVSREPAMYRPRNRPARATIRQPQPRMTSSFLVGWGGACWSGSGPRPPRATGSLRAAWTTTGSRGAAGHPEGTRGTERSEYRSALDAGGGQAAARPAGNRPVRAWAQGSHARRRRRGRSFPPTTLVSSRRAAGGPVVARTRRQAGADKGSGGPGPLPC